jgi:hypothetical protein
VTEDQVVALRDKMIAAQKAGPSPLAVKFDPMIRDRVIVSSALEASQKEIDELEAECLALAAKLHAQAIASLRSELANDPDGVGYAGKPLEEVQKLLSESVEFYVEREVPQNVIQPIELHRIALTRGVSVEQVEREYAAMREGEPPPPTERVMTGSRTAPITRVWRRIAYCRNVPSVDNIAEALQ